MQFLFNRLRIVGAILIVTAGLVALPARAAGTAPSTGHAEITAVDASGFPTIQAYALLNSAAGQHIPGLAAGDFALSENGQPVANLAVSEQDLGVQVVFALDTGDVFKARDANGVTRIDFVKQALAEYAQTKPWMKTGLDDVTVLAADVPVIEHNNDAALVARAVAGYQSTFVPAADPFTLVNSAITFASDVSPRPGMQHFVVLISNGFQGASVAAALADAAARATAAQVPVYTVFVGPLGAGNTVPAQNLKHLADLTGGQSLIFESPQSLTPLFQMLSDQSRQYRLSYRSSLSATGQNRLSLAATLPDKSSLSSGEVVFPLRVEAPSLVLHGLPPSLVRIATTANSAPDQAEPRVYDVPLTIDFPDGHPRELRLTQLLVDGQVVASQTVTSAVTSLAWPLASYTQSAVHRLQARVADELGLAAESQVVTVTVSLEMPAASAPISGPVRAMSNSSWPLVAMALGGLLVALAVGLGAWLVISRRQRLAEAEAEGEPVTGGAQAHGPRSEAARGLPQAARGARASPPAIGATFPNVTQPVKAARVNGSATAAVADATIPAAPARGLLAPTRPSGRAAKPDAEPPGVADTLAGRPARRALPHVALPSFHWPRGHAHAGLKGRAYLEVVDPGGGGAPQPAIELPAGSLTFGRDASVAEAVFHDRSVSRLHARIALEAGLFRIYDSDSTSGTWVNYAPIVGEDGYALQHGDLINLGRVQLRFQRRDSAASDGGGTRVARVAPVGDGAAVPPDAAAPQRTSDTDQP